MRRKISLYIGDVLADLADESLLLYNYQQDDLSNPTIVKNSYSQQITLPGTPANNRIFGHSFRVDRAVAGSGGTGYNFNPSIRTPFTIYDEKGGILESGYVRLDRMIVGKEYQVTLFGGLGDFFYNLSYKDDGTKRSLADLWYKRLEGLDEEEELDFDITMAALQEAWDAFRYGSGRYHMRWSVINFAPAYNGIPQDFAADKAIIEEGYAMGVHTSITIDDVTYTTRGGYALVNLTQPHDEWAMKELRSYLQRPIVSVKAILDAIADPYNNGGYTFDLSDLPRTELDRLWITRPMLPALGTYYATGGAVGVTFTPNWGSAIAGGGNLSEVPTGTEVSLRLSIYWQAIVDSTIAALSMSKSTSGTYSEMWDFTCAFVQVVGYDVDDNEVAAGQVVAVCDPLPGNTNWTCEALANACRYTPTTIPGQTDIYGAVVAPGGWNKAGAGQNYRAQNAIGMSCSGYDINHYRVWIRPYIVNGEYYAQTAQFTINGATAVGNSAPRLWDDATGDSYDATTATADTASDPIATTSSGSNVRSGQHITKRILLSSSKTPADYLLSLAKTFGFYFLYDQVTKTIKAVTRNSLYQDETIDLTKRIDTSRDIELRPLAFDAKWYDFSPAPAGGAWMDVYEKTYGIPYGIQRVNTGYDFDAQVEDLLRGTAFKAAAEVLDGGPLWEYLTDGGGNVRPAVFLESGNTVTLYDPAGNTYDLGISRPGSAFEAGYYNADHPGNDAYPRVEFRDEDNNPVDGEDVLVYYNGGAQMPYFRLTDDLSVMDLLNNGKPCWYLLPGSYDGGPWVPIFQRYDISTNAITQSLDFGVPRDIKIPELTYPESATIYARRWKAYFRDRYDVSTKVMRCWVQFDGMQVGQELLRKFYWYRGVLWTLNKISGYSLNSYEPTECEFVQVQDKDNYLNGQNFS